MGRFENGISWIYCRCIYYRCHFRNYSNFYVAYFIACYASLAFIWAFTIREPEGAPTSQKHLEPLLPVLKRPEVAAFFTIELFSFFRMHLF